MAAIKGGDKLAMALAKIAAGVSKPGTLSVGFLEGATAPNGDSIPERAANNEFGTPNAKYPIPPRPFFRTMIADKSPEWPAAVGNLLKANDYDATKALDIAGEAIEGQLRQSITDLTSPPLAEATIKAKGFDKPLIETSDMINAVAHIVKS
jgi:hypothetical protein